MMSNGDTPKINYGEVVVYESNGYTVVVKPVFGDQKYYFHEVSIFTTDGYYIANSIVWDFKNEDLKLYVMKAFNNRAMSICENLRLRE